MKNNIISGVSNIVIIIIIVIIIVFIITWSLLLFLNQAISGGGFPPEVRQVRLTMSPWKVHAVTVLFMFDENLSDYHTKFLDSMNLSIGTFDVPQDYRRSRRV